MTHAAFYPDENMIWIEGIRVNKNFRNNGIAQKMISDSNNKQLEEGEEQLRRVD